MLAFQRNDFKLYIVQLLVTTAAWSPQQKPNMQRTGLNLEEKVDSN